MDTTQLINQGTTPNTQVVSSASRLPSIWDLILVTPLSIYGDLTLKTMQSRIYERRLGTLTEKLLNEANLGSVENEDRN